MIHVKFKERKIEKQHEIFICELTFDTFIALNIGIFYSTKKYVNRFVFRLN